MSGVGGNLLGNNLFAYCFNNPVNYSDSQGNWPTREAIKNTWSKGKAKAGELLYDAYYNLTKWHFEDRIEANGKHPSYDEVTGDESEWIELPESESLYHIDDVGSPEKKFVHPDGREAVFDGDTHQPMEDPRYMATYNYVALRKPGKDGTILNYIDAAGSYVGHFVLDVLPYYITLKSNTREQFESKIIDIFT